MSDLLDAHSPVILDVAGTALTDADRRRLQHPLTGGLILFTRNWADRATLVALIAEAKEIRPDLLVCVDHEGGRVQRFRSDGFTPLPPMGAIGARWMRDEPGQTAESGHGAMAACDLAASVGYVLAAELRACGVDLSFTPVLDLDHGRSGVIGNRAFHADARVVSTLARSLTHGLLQAGMAHCGKHFPGHGWAQADSHVALARDERALAAILADDARPYDWLGATLSAVMPAHVVYPQVDARPAGYSARWLQDVLREQLGFTGLVFSDDLSMAAARSVADVRDGAELSPAEAATLALQAGCDAVLLCNQSLGDGAVLDRFLDELQAGAERGDWTPDAGGEARRQALLPQTAPLPWDELMHHAPYLRALERIGELG
ncbi:MAG: beta-N-acetylhexosaminidase [Leptothrix sp. (in: b-proteobacteria)]